MLTHAICESEPAKGIDIVLGPAFATYGVYVTIPQARELQRAAESFKRELSNGTALTPELAQQLVDAVKAGRRLKETMSKNADPEALSSVRRPEASDHPRGSRAPCKGVGRYFGRPRDDSASIAGNQSSIMLGRSLSSPGKKKGHSP